MTPKTARARPVVRTPAPPRISPSRTAERTRTDASAGSWSGADASYSSDISGPPVSTEPPTPHHTSASTPTGGRLGNFRLHSPPSGEDSAAVTCFWGGRAVTDRWQLITISTRHIVLYVSCDILSHNLISPHHIGCLVISS